MQLLLSHNAQNVILDINIDHKVWRWRKQIIHVLIWSYKKNFTSWSSALNCQRCLLPVQASVIIDFIENVPQVGCQKALYCKTYARFEVTLWATEIKKISLVSRSWSTVWINMQKMSNGDYFDEKMRRGDRSKEARRISPPLKLLLKSPKLRGSTAPKSAHLHRGREQGAPPPIP